MSDVRHEPVAAPAAPADAPAPARKRRFTAWSRMRARWGVSNWGVAAILLSFSLAGMTVVRVARPLLNALLPPDTPRWLWWTVRIVVFVPTYEVLLLGYGTLLGQRRFFWDKQKRLLSFLARPFTGRR